MKKKHEIELITLKVFWILNKAARNIHLTSHKKGALTLDFFDCAGAYCYIDMENKTKRKKLSSSLNHRTISILKLQFVLMRKKCISTVDCYKTGRKTNQLQNAPKVTAPSYI